MQVVFLGFSPAFLAGPLRGCFWAACGPRAAIWIGLLYVVSSEEEEREFSLENASDWITALTAMLRQLLFPLDIIKQAWSTRCFLKMTRTVLWPISTQSALNETNDLCRRREVASNYCNEFWDMNSLIVIFFESSHSCVSLVPSHFLAHFEEQPSQLEL